MDKNVTNPIDKKYLLSLGVDNFQDGAKAIIFKIWDFHNLIDYSEYTKDKLTGGDIQNRSANQPRMYKVLLPNGESLIDHNGSAEVKMFTVSKDCVYAALITTTNKLVIY